MDFPALELSYCGCFQLLELELKPSHPCLVEIELSRQGRCDLPLSPPVHRMEGASSHALDPLYELLLIPCDMFFLLKHEATN